MKNEFNLISEANTIFLKIVRFIMILSVGYAFVAYFKHYPVIQIYLVITSGLICEVLLTIVKSYMVIGKITFNNDNILVDCLSLKIDLPFSTVSRITFKIKGYKRTSYMPSIFQPIGVNRPKGTGNLMVIETKDRLYELNILLLNTLDAVALDYQVTRLKDSGLNVVTVRFPEITGDSI